MNQTSQLNTSSSCFRLNRVITLAIVGFYSTSSMLSGAVLLWLIDANLWIDSGATQTVKPLPSSIRDRDIRAQLPVLPPSPPVDPNSPNPIAPPPLGYPDQQSNGVPPEQFSRYRLGPGDAIAITVQRFPDLSFQGAINLEGNIAVPLLGTVKLTGLTLEAAQEKIRSGLNRYVVDPQVSVSLVGLRPVQVTVTGEVLRPGYYTLQPGSQLSAALLAAGGVSSEADLRTVIVRRRSLVDNSFSEQQIDLFTPLQNGSSLPALRLQDGDAVVVSKLEVGRTNDYDRSLVARSSVAQPQINIRVLSYPNGRIGNVTLPNGSTFIDALTAIAPSPDNARLGEIALIRYDPEQGKAVTQKLDGRRALMGDISQNVPLQNEDVIVVGRNLIGRVTYALGLITQPFTSILNFRSFFNNLTNFFGGNSNTNN
ncbi:MAG TPA: polysaccharide biosynthesis/export family protein [Allocoleopsis sp.]